MVIFSKSIRLGNSPSLLGQTDLNALPGVIAMSQMGGYRAVADYDGMGVSRVAGRDVADFDFIIGAARQGRHQPV